MSPCALGRCLWLEAVWPVVLKQGFTKPCEFMGVGEGDLLAAIVVYGMEGLVKPLCYLK